MGDQVDCWFVNRRLVMLTAYELHLLARVREIAMATGPVSFCELFELVADLQVEQKGNQI